MTDMAIVPEALATTVQPYLPDCLDGRLNGAFKDGEALEFNPASFDYYKVD
jgi:hypothetical protein